MRISLKKISSNSRTDKNDQNFRTSKMKHSPRLRRRFVPTLSSVIARYLDEVSSHKKGFAAERSIAKVWGGTRLAGRAITRISNNDLIALRDEWLHTKAPATVVRRLASALLPSAWPRAGFATCPQPSRPRADRKDQTATTARGARRGSSSRARWEAYACVTIARAREQQAPPAPRRSARPGSARRRHS